MIGFIRNKSLPARRYLVLLVLPWCLMLLLTVAVLWPYLVGFRTTVKTLQDVQLPGILEAQRTRTNLNMLRKQLPSSIWPRPLWNGGGPVCMPRPCWPAWPMIPRPWLPKSWRWGRASGSSM